jgi:HD-like signal output (HDOD) protein
MNTNIFQDSTEEFEERLETLYDQMESWITGLKSADTYRDSIDSLFREVHTLKALSFYLEMDAVFKTLHALENILAILRHKNPPLRAEITDWLLMFSDHIGSWYTMFKDGEQDFEPIDALTINMLSGVVTLSKKGSEILQSLELMVIGPVSSSYTQVEASIKAACNIYTHEKKLKEGLSKLQKGKVNIVMISSSIGFDNLYLLLKQIKKSSYNLPVIILDDAELSGENRNSLKRFGIEHYVDGTMTKAKLINKLTLLASAYYQDSGIKFLNSPMLEAIENLQPLPQSIIEINEYRLNPDAPVSELTSIIMKDAQLSAKLLKFVNSATFNLAANVASIQHAISLLGREQVIALALQTVADDLFTIDLSPYGITQEEFYAISQQRMMLIMQWYRKISLPDLSLLTTAALLGSIGQILVADDVIQRGISAEFKSLVLSTEPVAAEVELTNSTAEDVTADIMTHWGLDDELINVIRYSRDLANAPRELKNLALAVHIVFKSFLSDGRPLEDETVEYLCELLEELNFDSNLYREALTKVIPA